MKRTTLLLLCVVLTLPALADESFVLNIPIRFNPQQETGEVRIVLALSAAPAGAQLVVNGSTTINLGSTTNVNGDSVAFEAGSGNAARITYKPLTNFGANFCDAASAIELNIPMRFVGAQDIVSYRVSTYVVGAPSAECSKVSKRTNDSPANLIAQDDGVAPALDALYKGRLPLDVVLVLDKSGSMSELPPGASSGASKAEILKAAINAFVAQWRLIDEETPEGIEWSQDRIGVVFFDSTSAAQSIVGADAPANFFVQRGPGGPGPSHKWNNVVSTITGLTPGGSTTVGGGVNTAMSQWVADPDNDLYLIVVTDGMQNTAPLITPAGGFLTLPAVGGLDPELRKRFIPIQTIGFGIPAAVDADLLTKIALETSGVSFITVNEAMTFDAFGLTLVGILKGNTASLVLRKRDSLGNGAGPSAPESVLVDASARRAVFSVQWAPPHTNALDLEVFRPDGTLATPSSSEKIPQASLQAFNMTREDLGKWSVRVKRAKGVANRPVPYNLNVFFLERSLDYRFSFDDIRARTGDKIRLRATVSYDGKPLSGLPRDAIRVRVLGPSAALGTILHDTKTSAGGPSTLPSGDVQTPYALKLARLGKRVLDRVIPRDVDTITLREEKDGVYVAEFEKTELPGTYAFEAVLDWDHKRTGPVHRVERIEHIVRVHPDADKTVIATMRSGSTVRVQVTPRDRFGNYVGPGYASLVRAQVRDGGKLRSEVPVDRNQTGTYEFTLTDVPSGVIPSVDITVDGVPVGKRR